MDLSKLKEPMPFRWRIQNINDYSALCVAYIDSRQVQDKLDEAVGPENWQSDYKVVNNNMYASVSIKCNNEWIYKWDCGVESNTEKEKGEASDAFKRAAVKWGVGRFLYDLPLQKLSSKKHTNGKLYACTDKGEIIWDGDSLTDYINSKLNKKVEENPSSTKPDQQSHSERYQKQDIPVPYTIPNKPTWTSDLLDRASKIEKDGLKGSTLLNKYLSDYNKKMKTTYKSIPELNTNEKLESLIKFVEDLPPAGLI